MLRRTPRPTRTEPLFRYRTLIRSGRGRLAPKTKPWTSRERLPDKDVLPSGAERNRDAFVRWMEGMPRRVPDYDPAIVRRFGRRFGRAAEAMLADGIGREVGGLFEAEQIGRASCRERVCQYV